MPQADDAGVTTPGEPQPQLAVLTRRGPAPADAAGASGDGLATLTLNRPEARNALSLELLSALHARVDELEADPPKVLTITGEGRAFCAGMDLKEVLGSHEASLRLLTSLAELTFRLAVLPSVLIARVNGAAIGGGCGLSCVCDVTVTHAEAKLGFPEVDLGLCPAVIAPWVARKLGPARARRALLLGGTMTGVEAGAIGLADVVAESREALDGAGAHLTDSIAAGGPEALRATRSLLGEIDGTESLRAMLLRGAELSASVLAGDEAQARLRDRFG